MRVRAFLLGATLTAAGLPAPARADAACTPWPGEFQPLPRVDDADPLRARFAHMRADRLAQLARELEERDRVESNRLWQRVLCFDAASAAARAGVERTRPTVVLRLPSPPAPEPAAAPEPRPRPAPRPAGADLAPLIASLGRVEQQLREARFEEALADLRALRGRLPRAGDSPRAGAERVRLEVLTATAYVAYGDEAAARASLRRALDVDPQLAFDPGRTSPKLRRALEAARREAQP